MLLKNLSNFWSTFENLILTQSEKCMLSNDVCYQVLVVLLSTQDNAKLLQQLKPGFKRTIGKNINQNNNTSAKLIFRLLNTEIDTKIIFQLLK